MHFFAGMGVTEGIRLRVKDVDFERHVIMTRLVARDRATTAQRMRKHFTNGQ